MNELLRYLNIYAHNFVWCNLDFMYDWQRIRVQWDELWPYVAESIITNKKFGFIKRLVDNDKIDRDKNVLAFEFSSVYTYDGEYYEDHIKECKLLMLLAIQSEPLKFLISILK